MPEISAEHAAQLELAGNLPSRGQDLHFNSRGERVYLDSVKFIPAGRITGCSRYKNGQFEHDDSTEALITIAMEGSWAEYAVPPITMTGSMLSDGHHRMNSALVSGPETLVPVIYIDPVTFESPEWLSPGITPVYRVCEVTYGEPYFARMLAIRRPEWMDRTLGELLTSIENSPIIHPYWRKPVSMTEMMNAFAGKGKGKVLQMRFDLVTVEVLESKLDAPIKYLNVKRPDFSAEDLLLLVSSGTINGKNGAKALRRTLRELFKRPRPCDEIEIHLELWHDDPPRQRAD